MPADKPKSTRRTPSQRRALEVVSAIRAAAAQVLVKHGYAHATTNRIAAVAGVSIGTLYQYFDGKDAIFDALAERFVSEVSEAVLEAATRTEGMPLEARARELTHAGAHVLQRHPGLLRALDAATGARFRAALHAARAGVRSLVEQVLAGEAGRIDDEVRRRARLLTVMAEGAALDIEPGDDLAWLADEMARLIVDFVEGRSPRGAS